MEHGFIHFTINGVDVAIEWATLKDVCMYSEEEIKIKEIKGVYPVIYDKTYFEGVKWLDENICEDGLTCQTK